MLKNIPLLNTLKDHNVTNIINYLKIIFKSVGFKIFNSQSLQICCYSKVVIIPLSDIGEIVLQKIFFNLTNLRSPVVILLISMYNIYEPAIYIGLRLTFVFFFCWPNPQQFITLLFYAYLYYALVSHILIYFLSLITPTSLQRSGALDEEVR